MQLVLKLSIRRVICNKQVLQPIETENNVKDKQS